jgi:hydrogenase maturation factor HypF (carbamoyltransferase family)
LENMENQPNEIYCPECRNHLTVRLIQVAHEEKICCPTCQKKTQLKDKDRNVRRSLEAFKKLGNTVKNININVKTSARDAHSL